MKPIVKTPMKKIIKSERTKILSNINNFFYPGKDNVSQKFIYLIGEVDTDICERLLKEIIFLNTTDFEENSLGKKVKREPIDVINMIINSSGGDMDAAIGLITVMEASLIPVRTIAIGDCSSAALFILMAGDQKIVAPLTSILSHQFSSGIEGTFNNIRSSVKEFNTYNEKMILLYQKFTGLSRDIIEKELMTSDDVFLTPEQALQYNICHMISNLV